MQQPWLLRPIELKARQIHRIDDGRGVGVTCLKGTVWITQDRDLRDVVLTPGESFVLDRNGVALVFAFMDAAVHVGQPVSPASQITLARDRAA